MSKERENASEPVTLLRTFSKDRRTGLIVAAGVLGMLLILATSFFDQKPAEKPQKETAAAPQDYARQLELRLEEILTMTKGVGHVKVLVTLSNSSEYVYAKDEESSSDKTTTYDAGQPTQVQEKQESTQNYVLIDGSDTGRQALVLTCVEPKIKGVVVICTGADNVVVREQVTQAVRTALGIGANQVYVMQATQ
jgi:stage III sporulation protein AG